MSIFQLPRRRFFQLASALGTWALQSAAQQRGRVVPAPSMDRAAVKYRKPYIAIQVGAVSFVDEGTERVLDILQERAKVNTLWLNTYSFERGTGGRQIPGHPYPDHGVQSEDTDYQGGAFYDYNPKYFERTCVKDFRSPNYNRIDIIREVAPKAAKRGIDVVAWDYNNADAHMPARVPGFRQVLEIDVYGRPHFTACFNNPDYREHLFAKTEDYLKTYPELSGIAWGCERMGPLMNMIGGNWSTAAITCFCPFCEEKGRQRGISFARARQGYIELDRLFTAARQDQRPADGYFVSFWRLLLEYPEILAWETLWTETYHEVRARNYGIAKSIAPEKPFGFHIMHNNTISPFYRAEENFARTKDYADYVKQVVYNNCAGPRLAHFLDLLGASIFHDAKPEDFIAFHYKIMGYKEAPYAQLSTAGLSSDYVLRETKRAIAGVSGDIPVYPGIDIDVPTNAGEKQTTPQDVSAAVQAAFAAGAPGVVLSRKYSEMKLANLSGAGEGLRNVKLA